MDADCPSKLACFSGECRNPCVETKPCKAHAICSVVDSLPLRTMVCQCEPGYIGDADVSCVLGKFEFMIIIWNVFTEMIIYLTNNNNITIKILIVYYFNKILYNFQEFNNIVNIFFLLYKLNAQKIHYTLSHKTNNTYFYRKCAILSLICTYKNTID